MDTTDVIVVGAGPTGLMLACELALAGVKCRLLEKRGEQANLTRAFGVHARALELLDARGLADDLVDRGLPLRRLHPAWGPELDLSELDTRYPMLLIVPQSGTERLLEQRAARLGVEIARGAELVGLHQDADAVVAELGDGTRLRANYLVGADGAHSRVRDLTDVGFSGTSYTLPMLLADVRLPDLPGTVLTDNAGRDGVVLAVPFGDGWFRVGAWMREGLSEDRDPGIAELRAAFRRVASTDYGMSEPRWISRFTSESRQADRYRDGRVLLAGDAAHSHSPMGGQGMNTGLQDAINLGWKLSAAVHGWAPPWLLDSYHRERHPVGRRVLQLTERLTHSVVSHSRIRRLLLHRVVDTLLRFAPTRRRMLDRITGLAITYPPHRSGAHPLAGHRAPDWATTEGSLYRHLRGGRFVLLHRHDDAITAAAPWSDRLHPATPTQDLPAETILVRPDGYIAWAGAHLHLETALTEWCGTRTTSSNGH